MKKYPLCTCATTKIWFGFGLGILAHMAVAETAPPSPFADTPLYFHTTPSSMGKPNIMLLLDDSGSMDDMEFKGSTKRKIDVLKNTVSALLKDPESAHYNWGLEVLNGYRYNPLENDIELSDTLSQPLQELTPTHRKNLLNTIQNLYANGGTPATWRYYQTAMKLTDQIQYRCQTNHLILLSDGEPNHFFYQPHGTPLDIRGNPTMVIDDRFKHANTPISYSEWIDSIPYQNNHYQEFIGVSEKHGLSYLSRQFANMDLKQSGTDQEGGSWNDDAFPKQTITTHTIAFGEEVLSNDQAKNYLKNGADYGGGLYREAKDAHDLMHAFSDILNAKVKPFKGYSSIAPALVSTPEEGIAAVSTLDSENWSSEIYFVALDKSGNPITESNGQWRYQTADFGHFDQHDKKQRRVLLANRHSLDFFEDEQAPIDNKMLGIHSTRPNEWAQTFIPWISRYSTIGDPEIDGDAKSYSGTNLRYRQRSQQAVDGARQMGDIIDTNILSMGEFSPQHQGNQRYLVAAANDGMVHIFAAQNAKGKDKNSPDYHPYALKANYIPGGIQREDPHDTITQNLRYQTQPQYGKDPRYRHVYLINGGMASRTTDATNADHRQTFVVVNTGQGGKGTFALNIGGKNRHSGQNVGVDADLSQLKNTIPLWDTGSHAFGAAAAQSQKLGYTVSTPVIARVATQWNGNSANIEQGVRYAAFIANGQDGKDPTPTLYIYDALGQEVGTAGSQEKTQDKGRLLKKISVPSDPENPPQKGKGLSSPTVVDVDFDGVADVVYAGDYNGNLYRFDLRSNISEWHATRIFQGNPKQPISAAPSVSPRGKEGEYMVLFGTGSDIYEADLYNREMQSFYGILDNINQQKSHKKSDLLQQTLTTAHDNLGELRHVSNHPMHTATGQDYSGWYIDLYNRKPVGERVVTKAEVIDETVFFTTRTFHAAEENKNAVCAFSGSSGFSWLMAVNIANGGQLSNDNPRFDQKSKDGQNYAGIRFSGILSPTMPYLGQGKNTADDPAEKNLGIQELKQNGEFRNNGYSKKLGKKYNTPKRGSMCGNKGGINALFFTASDTGIGKVNLKFKKCGTVKRIAWREIF